MTGAPGPAQRALAGFSAASGQPWWGGGAAPRDRDRAARSVQAEVGGELGAFAAASFHWCWSPGAPRLDLAAPRVASAGEWGGERTLAPQMNLVVPAAVAPEEGLRAFELVSAPCWGVCQASPALCAVLSLTSWERSGGGSEGNWWQCPRRRISGGGNDWPAHLKRLTGSCPLAGRVGCRLKLVRCQPGPGPRLVQGSWLAEVKEWLSYIRDSPLPCLEP